MKKKLIEVALPLEAINQAAAFEKGNPFLKGHPRGIHQWWARRPLAVCRAVIFAQMVDDPSANPDLFPTPESQQKERQRLFKIIEDLSDWRNTANEVVLQKARDEIWQSWRRACAANADHPNACALFNRNRLPSFHDPFAGGGALPLEAQRLGLSAYASDLNPVAVLINKAMIEIPPIFAGCPPINPLSQRDAASKGSWKGAAGLAEDVRYYGQWLQREAELRIGACYPSVEISREMIDGRPDLEPYLGKKLNVIAWLWARTVPSPNPAFRDVHVPLAATFVLSTKKGKEAYIEPLIRSDGYQFAVRRGPPTPEAKNGTKLARGANFKCLMSGVPISGDYIKEQAKAGRLGTRLMALVVEGVQGRVYLSPLPAAEKAASEVVPTWMPTGCMVEDARAFTPSVYGLVNWSDLFTARQVQSLTTFSDLIGSLREAVLRDASQGWCAKTDIANPESYSNAISVFMALCIDKFADYNNSLCMWNPTNENVGHLFTKQAIPISWDFCEASPFIGGLAFSAIADGVAKSIELLPASGIGKAFQKDCATLSRDGDSFVISTDPPYYDNVPYADLSDFFYVWLRRSLREIVPDFFTTVAVPKADELVATPYRHGGKQEAEAFFLEGMTRAMRCIADEAHPFIPITIYYAFKQSENSKAEGSISTGWETFLDAVIRAGLSTSGTWPVRTEREARSRGLGSNALASSIVLVCRPRAANAPTATRREYVAALRHELPEALRHLQAGNIAPVDLAQAAIGPGMAVYTRYSKVLDASGEPMRVREALALINEVLDEALAEQEGDFDADSRWALAWFEENGFGEGDYGRAEQLSKSKNTSVAGMVEAGILLAKRGKARLLKPDELPEDWDPSSDSRLTAWESVHHLIRALNSGEQAAANLVEKLGSHAETARELAYRLYVLCERKKRATEALAYNSLVQSWPEIVRLAKQGSPSKEVAPQAEMFAEE